MTNIDRKGIATAFVLGTSPLVSFPTLLATSLMRDDVFSMSSSCFVIASLLYGLGTCIVEATERDEAMALVIGGFVGLLMSVLGKHVFHDPRLVMGDGNEHTYWIFQAGVVVVYALVFRYYVLPLLCVVRTFDETRHIFSRSPAHSQEKPLDLPLPPRPEDLE